MTRAIALARRSAALPAEGQIAVLLRTAIVTASGLALVFAGKPLPF